MSRILFAWELGANFGHLTRNLAIARRLRERGHEALFVVRDTRSAEELLTPHEFRFAPTPAPAEFIQLRRPQISYADVLAVNGYADRLTLLGLLRGWLTLYDLIRPDVVVIDHAPTALLSARAGDIPAVLLGSGFDVPPLVAPLPAIRVWETSSREMLATAEASVLHNINAALETLGSPRIVRVAEMFEGVPALMSTFAELDHYGPRAHATYVGPIGLRQLAHEAAWREIGGPRILAYLRPALPCLEAALGAMNKFPGEVICVVPGLSPTLARRFASPRMRLFDRPISVPDLLPKADLVVSYGGAATVAGSLLAGAPLLLASHTVEQHMVTVRVAEVGAGVVLTRERSERDFVRALAEATANPGYKAAARRFADRYSTFTEARAIERVTSVLESAARSVQ